MSKTNSAKYLILAGIFVVTFGIGYFGVKVVCNSKSTDKETIAQNDKETSAKGEKPLTPPNKKKSPEAPADTVATQPAITETQGQTNPGQEASINKEKISLNPSKPELWGDSYRFKCTCTGVPEGTNIHYELWSNRLVQSSQDGNFKNVPGIAGGKYKLCLVKDENENLVTIRVSGFMPIENEDSQKSGETGQEKPKKPLITKDEFEKKMLNPNDNSLVVARRATDKNTVLAHGFSITIVGMATSEKNLPTDIEGIHDKIHFGIWKSASVIELVYNEKTGQVTKATISPVY